MGMSKYSIGQIEIIWKLTLLVSAWHKWRLSGLMRMKTKRNHDHLIQLSTHLWAHGRLKEVLSSTIIIIKASGDIT